VSHEVGPDGHRAEAPPPVDLECAEGGDVPGFVGRPRQHQVALVTGTPHLGLPVAPVGPGPGLDLVALSGAGQEPATRIVGDPVQVDIHVEVGPHPQVAPALEEAQQPGLGDRGTGPKEVRRIGTGGEAGVPGVDGPALGRVEQGVPASPTPCRGIDHEEADVGAILTFDDSHEGDRRVTEDLCRLVSGDQRALELGDAGRIVERAGTEGGQSVEVAGAQRSSLVRGSAAVHWRDAAQGIEASKLSCVRARSKF
jgi:hypothetical protein